MERNSRRYVVNEAEGKTWPLELLDGKELHIAFEQVLVDEEAGVKLRGAEDWRKLRTCARYQCEREWQLRAGQSWILAKFTDEKAAQTALKYIMSRIDKGGGTIHIPGAARN